MRQHNGRNVPTEYEIKFANFIRMCAEAKQKGAECVIVAKPSVLGDDYAEMRESLSRLARAGLQLNIAHPE
jgi:RNase P protein component